MRRRLKRTNRQDVQTVDVTAFLSLMVILVPFLLATSVFSRTTILEVQAVADQEENLADTLQLQVVVRSAVFEISHAGRADAEIIERGAGERSLTSLAESARRLKSQYPRAQEATVLVEPQVDYEVVVRVLDTLRIRTSGESDDQVQEPLFPQIALRPAPTAKRGGGTGQ